MNITPKDHQDTKTNRKRPAVLTALCILFSIFSAYKLFSLLFMMLRYEILSELPLSVSPIYLGITNLIWVAAGLLLSWSIAARKSWTPLAGTILVVSYEIYFWIDRVWVTAPEQNADGLAFTLVMRLIGLALVLGILNLKSTRNYFGRNAGKIP